MLWLGENHTKSKFLQSLPFTWVMFYTLTLTPHFILLTSLPHAFLSFFSLIFNSLWSLCTVSSGLFSSLFGLSQISSIERNLTWRIQSIGELHCQSLSLSFLRGWVESFWMRMPGRRAPMTNCYHWVCWGCEIKCQACLMIMKNLP